jgi:alkylated DNA repair dioxygenase AlkB
MRDLRDDPNTNALYKGIVRLAILQGTYQSPISIKNIIPVEDYAAHITPIISGLRVDDELRAFAKSNEFQRNEWQDNDIVPIVEPKFSEVEGKVEDPYAPRIFQAALVQGKEFIYKGAFPNLPGLVKSKERQLLFLNSKYNAKVTKYDVVKVPRAVSINKDDVTEGKVDVTTGKEITNQTYAEKLSKGDTSLRNYYGYQKVKYADGSPLIAEYDKEGNPIYVYKFINLHGDGMYASEYYGDGRPSIFNNGSQKNVKNVGGTLVSNEIPDQDIINYYGGESVPLDEADPITATIEKESEKVVSLQPSTSVQPKGEKVKEGIYVNQAALTKEEQLELFNYLKPFLEEQASKTNKGVNASKMIGLGLRWDYKSNNPGKQSMNIPDVINSGNKDKYGYYNTSINDQPLGQITPRFRELMEKATGVDMTHYDGAIINLYDNESFISTHNDVDESRSAIKYPVIGINLGGTGNFSIESRDGSPKQLNLKAGTGYVFGVDSTNRAVFHRTFPGKQDSFLPALTTKLDGKTYEPGSYRVTITMRRVMPLTPDMPTSPSIKTGQQPTSVEGAQVAPEVRYKDAAKRIRIEYPSEIKVEETGDTFNINKLLETLDVFTKEDDGTMSDGRKFDSEYEDWLGGYGMTNNQYEYALKNQEVLRDLLFIADNELSDNEGNSLEFTTIEDVINEILKRNEKLIDTAQGRFFIGFDTTNEFTDAQKNKILANFGAKHKMNVEKAREYINQAMAEEPQKTIDKLKECYL